MDTRDNNIKHRMHILNILKEMLHETKMKSGAEIE